MSAAEDGIAITLAFSEQISRLYVENRGKLQGFLTKRYGAADEAEDVMHEAFARLWSTYGKGASVTNPLGMLYRIAVNIMHDETRSRSFRRRQLAGISTPVCSAPPEPEPEAAVSALQRLRLLERAVNDLPPRCQEVFLLHKVEGLAHSEISARMGISRNMVEKHIIRAYTHLRNAMDAEHAMSVDNSARARF